MNKWINVPEDGAMYTEIMDIGFEFLLRSFSWDSERECAVSVAMVKIDRITGGDIIKSLEVDDHE